MRWFTASSPQSLPRRLLLTLGRRPGCLSLGRKGSKHGISCIDAPCGTEGFSLQAGKISDLARLKDAALCNFTNRPNFVSRPFIPSKILSSDQELGPAARRPCGFHSSSSFSSSRRSCPPLCPSFPFRTLRCSSSSARPVPSRDLQSARGTSRSQRTESRRLDP